MINKILAVVISAVWMFPSCQSPERKEMNEISNLEKELYNDSSMTFDKSKADKMISLYKDYAAAHPDDTISPVYLFRAGDLASKSNNTSEAISLFDQLVKKYPQHRNVPLAIFLQGFIYENQAGDPLRAKPYYEEFLRKYPDHPIAGDVSFALENLGKTPEELIREFEKNSENINQADSTNS